MGGRAEGRRSRRARASVLALLSLGVAAAAACGGDEDAGSRDLVVAPAAATLGPAGGALESGPVRLDVPAGALAAEVPLALASVEAAPTVDGITRLGPMVEVGPAGTAFAVPASLALPYDPGAVPRGAAEAGAAVWTAATDAGPWTPLATAVDGAADLATAQVPHLSRFFVGVRAASPPACPGHVDGCGCDDLRADRPLAVTGTRRLERRLERLCHRPDAGEVEVLSYTTKPRPDGSGFLDPDRYFLTRLDEATLAVRSEVPADAATGLADGRCVPDEPDFLSGRDEPSGVAWRFRVEPRRKSDLFAAPDWYEEVLEVAEGALRFSMNGWLNEAEPYRDDYFLSDDDVGGEGRVHPDGSARFYFLGFHDYHLDVVHLDDLDGMLAQPEAHLGEGGFHTPTLRARLDLLEGRSNSGYAFDPLVVSPAPDDPDADIVVMFRRRDRADGQPGSSLIGLRVTREDVAQQRWDWLPDLDLDPFYGQSHWHNAGLDARGLLYAQAQVAGFTNSMLLTLDPAAFALVGQWEIGCLHAPRLRGFALIPGRPGLVVRYADDVVTGEELAMFVQDGTVLAYGTLPPTDAGPLSLVSGDRVYAIDDKTTTVTALAVP